MVSTKTYEHNYLDLNIGGNNWQTEYLIIGPSVKKRVKVMLMFQTGGLQLSEIKYWECGGLNPAPNPAYNN